MLLALMVGSPTTVRFILIVLRSAFLNRRAAAFWAVLVFDAEPIAKSNAMAFLSINTVCSFTKS